MGGHQNFQNLLFISLCGLLAIGLTEGIRVSILPSDKNVAKFLNESYFVSCQSDQKGMYWSDPKNEKILSDVRNRVHVMNGIGLELYLYNVTSEDEGTYTCITPADRTQFNLIVVRPIIFDTSFSVQYSEVGNSFVLTCPLVVSHSTNPQRYWKVDLRPPQGPNFQPLRNGSLLIRNVTEGDTRRNYICRVVDIQSPKPDTKQMEITLKIKRWKPRSVDGRDTHKQIQWGVLTEWKELTCTVDAVPPAVITWYHGTTKLADSDDTKITRPLDNTSLLQVYLNNEKLGEYTCVAMNELGSYTQTITLNRGMKPPMPILRMQSIGWYGVILRTTIDEDPNRYHEADEDLSFKYVVQCKILNKGNWTTVNADQTTNGFVLRSLNPNTTYIIRAALQNEAVTGDYSSNYQFTTLPSGRAYDERCENIGGDHNCDDNLTCQDGVCKCSSPQVWNLWESKCVDHSQFELYCQEHQGGFYVQKLETCQLRINGPCDPHKSNEEPLCPEHSQCVYPASTCQCKKNYTMTSLGHGCNLVQQYGEVCDPERDQVCSSLSRLECISGLCSCPINMIRSAVDNICKFREGEKCRDTSSCAENSSCGNLTLLVRETYCRCNDKFSPDSAHVCLGEHSAPCKTSLDCHSGSACLDGSCRCRRPRNQYYDLNQKKCVNLIDSPCYQNESHCPEHSTCKDGICKCLDGWKKSVRGRCAKLLGFGEACEAEECNFSEGLACISKVCTCFDPLLKFIQGKGCTASVGQQCGFIESVGGTCTRESESLKECDFYQVSCETPAARCNHVGSGFSICETD